jgi:hypothetical protein
MYGAWWSATENSTYYMPWSFKLYDNSGGVSRGSSYGPNYGFSVRCVKD